MSWNEAADGPEGKAECQQVLHDVWLFLDNEMDTARRITVERHIYECAPCLDETDVGERLKSLLHRKCGGEVAPAVLRERLIAALQQRTPRP